jgi:hypothetical protein
MDRTFKADLDGSSTRTVPLLVAQTDLTLRAATFAQELDTDGDKTCHLRNVTQGLNLTDTLDVDALGALGQAAFANIVATPIKKGDLLALVYTVTTAGTVHPGEVAISAVFDEPLGQGHGPAFAS